MNEKFLRTLIRDILKENFQNKVIAYHGTNHDITKFDFHEGIGEGHDQDGVGIYFSSEANDSSYYGNNIYQVELSLDKVVPLDKKVSSKPIEFMMKTIGTERLNDVLSNWDENPRIAYRNLLNSIMEQDNAHQQFLTVWYELYRRYPIDYLKNMIKLGYDGVVIPKPEVTHYIIFNPEKIKIVGKVD